MVAPSKTPLMEMPIPIENEDPFFTKIGQFFTALDAWVQAIREDTGVFLSSTGGTWSVNLTADEVSWSGNVVISSATNGGTATVTPGSASCTDGQLIYMTIPNRPIGRGDVGAISADDNLPALSGLVIPIAFRAGSSVVMLGRGAEPGRGSMPRTWRGWAATTGMNDDAGGTGAAACWTPRLIHYPDKLDLPVEIVRHDILSASAASDYFRVDGDQTRFYPVGKRFSCMLSGTANDTTDAEFIVATAVYDAGNDWTTITINTSPAAYLKDAVVDIMAPAGTLFPGWFGLTAAARTAGENIAVWLTIGVEGNGCDQFGARLAEDDLAAPTMTFEADNGSVTGGGAWNGAITSLGDSPPGGAAQFVTGSARTRLELGDVWYLLIQYQETTGAGPVYDQWGKARPALSGLEHVRVFVSMIEVEG
jgi:hypothetical protein